MCRTLQVSKVASPGLSVGRAVANREGSTSCWPSSHMRRMSGGEKPDTSHRSHRAALGEEGVARRLTERLLGALAAVGEAGEACHALARKHRGRSPESGPHLLECRGGTCTAEAEAAGGMQSGSGVGRGIGHAVSCGVGGRLGRSVGPGGLKAGLGPGLPSPRGWELPHLFPTAPSAPWA